jgi:hypothetical protein
VDKFGAHPVIASQHSNILQNVGMLSMAISVLGLPAPSQAGSKDYNKKTTLD